MTIILQVKNLLLPRMLHGKFGRIPSRIKEVGTILRCEGKPVAPNMATKAKRSYDDWGAFVTFYKINHF